MKPSKEVSENWHVVFINAENDNILTKYLQKGFQHVYAMRETDGGFLWQVIDPTQSHIHLSLVSTNDFPHPRLYAGADAVIIPVTVHISRKSKMARLCVFNCVEVIKGVLGIKDFFIHTPYQLYKYLINKGGA